MIHINLLAEAQALEEQRRKDPVKYVILAGAVAVALILMWSSSLLVQTVIAKGTVNRLDHDLNSRTNQWRQVLANQQKLADTRHKLAALRQLSENRFLLGNLLEALQQTTVSNVQLVRLKLNQVYIVTAPPKPKPGTRAKPATATEQITLTLNAKDASPRPGDGVPLFQDALSRAPYFQDALKRPDGFRLISLSPPQADPAGGSCVLFTLEARFPDRTR